MVKDIRTLRVQSESLRDSTYEIIFTSRFKKAWNKYSKSGRYNPENFYEIMRKLSRGDTLDRAYKDHELRGNLSGFRECHIESDLLVIYKIEGNIIKFLDFGTHSELFG